MTNLTHAAVTTLVFTVVAASGFAAANSATSQCAESWKADKVAGKIGNQTWPQYLSECSANLAEAATTKATKKAKMIKAEAEDESDTALKKHAINSSATPAQKAMYKRMRQCGKMWKADKAAGKTGKKTWPQYWDTCSDKLKK